MAKKAVNYRFDMELIEHLKSIAEEKGISVNKYIEDTLWDSIGGKQDSQNLVDSNQLEHHLLQIIKKSDKIIDIFEERLSEREEMREKERKETEKLAIQALVSCIMVKGNQIWYDFSKTNDFSFSENRKEIIPPQSLSSLDWRDKRAKNASFQTFYISEKTPYRRCLILLEHLNKAEESYRLSTKK